MNNDTTELSANRGASILLLVFIISIILALFVLGIQTITLSDSRRISQMIHSQTAFFAAEGAVYETLQHLYDDANWPPFDINNEYSDEYQVDHINIQRSLKNLDGAVEIDVTATYKNTKRRIIASFDKTQSQRKPLDIVLVIDRSGSMANNPIKQAKIAARDFVDYPGLNAQDRIGLVTFSYPLIKNCQLAQLDAGLTTLDSQSNVDHLKSLIQTLSAQGYTNIGHGLLLARQELNDNGREEANKVIILLTDGVANRYYDGSCTHCGDWTCLNPSIVNSFRPKNAEGVLSGNYCSEKTIFQADNIKNQNTHLFTIFLTNIYSSDCDCTDIFQCPYVCTGKCIPSTEELARKTLQEAATSSNHYFETASPEELKTIYEMIASTVTTPEYFEIKEAIPEPE